MSSELLSEGGLEKLKQLDSGFKQYVENQPINFNIFTEGSEQIVSKYDFSNAKLENKDGTMAIGEHQTISNTVIKSSKEALSFKDEIDKSDLPANKKEEIKDEIDFVEKELKGEKPNKTVIKSVLDSIKVTLGGIATASGVMQAYEQWLKYVQPILENLG